MIKRNMSEIVTYLGITVLTVTFFLNIKLKQSKFPEENKSQKKNEVYSSDAMDQTLGDYRIIL